MGRRQSVNTMDDKDWTVLLEGDDTGNSGKGVLAQN